MSRANPATTHDNAGIAAWRFNLDAEIHSFNDAFDFLSAGYYLTPVAKRRERKLGPQMEVHENDGYIAVKLYRTDIIRYYPDDTFSVDNGGYATPTTRERLGAVTPDGFYPYHRRKKLGLHTSSGITPPQALWPLDHSRRIDSATGEIK